jgi:hemerythrin-like domain-containing protein
LILGVVVIVRVGTLVKELKETVQHLERGSNDVANDIHRRIEDEVRELRTKIDFNEREIFSQLDSRLDKLESRISRQKTQVPKG